MNATEKTYVYLVVDASGEYVRNALGDKRTPDSDDAYEFSSREAAEENCTRATDRVIEVAAEVDA